MRTNYFNFLPIVVCLLVTPWLGLAQDAAVQTTLSDFGTIEIDKAAMSGRELAETYHKLTGKVVAWSGGFEASRWNFVSDGPVPKTRAAASLLRAVQGRFPVVKFEGGFFVYDRPDAESNQSLDPDAEPLKLEVREPEKRVTLAIRDGNIATVLDRFTSFMGGRVEPYDADQFSHVAVNLLCKDESPETILSFLNGLLQVNGASLSRDGQWFRIERMSLSAPTATDLRLGAISADTAPETRANNDDGKADTKKVQKTQKVQKVLTEKELRESLLQYNEQLIREGLPALPIKK